MAEGGYDVKYTRLDNTDKPDEDGDGNASPPTDANETREFDIPGASSTPAQRQTQMNRPGEESYSFPDTPGLSTTSFAEKLKNLKKSSRTLIGEKSFALWTRMAG